MTTGDQMMMVYMLERGAPVEQARFVRSRLVYGSRVRKVFGVQGMIKENICSWVQAYMEGIG